MEIKKIKIVSLKKTDYKEDTWDISTVNSNHNFFIGEKQVLTHNCDFITAQGMAALRNLMETFSKTTRFILTANYVEKIIEPIQSRCQVFNVCPPSKKDIAVHVSKILQKENIEFDIKDLAFIVNSSYPDIRKIINICQQQSINGKLQLDKQTLIESNYMLKLLEMLKSYTNKKEAIKNIRQLIADSQVKQFNDLYKFLYDNIDEFSKGNDASVILILAEAQVNDSFSVDKEINIMSMIVKLVTEL